LNARWENRGNKLSNARGRLLNAQEGPHHGEVVEYGPVARIFSAPQHAYTRQLLLAIPLPDVEPGWLDDTSPNVTSVQQGSAA
jgi:hypothetical protein